jgi:HSP20 family molecular chaperone IbpA
MPENVDLDMAKAVLEKNVLVIKIPKLKFNNQTIKIDKIDD